VDRVDIPKFQHSENSIIIFVKKLMWNDKRQH